ncbi:uncharacterized protein LOC134099279 [Sardina pilchardus]|uniref:uncharacterized protein LOC134099279 n=1 Tax=Sardina pilchardus TaxID=27697 RepID=UPI002E15B42D
MPYWIHLLFVLAAKCAVVAGEDSVVQPHGIVTTSEGDSVTIACHYKTTDSSPYLFWYQQLPNGSPEYMLITYTNIEGYTEEKFKKRFHSKADSASKTVPLTIQDLQVSDSAVYYCALRTTVTAAHSTLIQKHLYQPLQRQGVRAYSKSLKLTMALWTRMLVFLVANVAMAAGQDSVNQTDGVLRDFQGAEVTIVCHYKTSDPSPSLLWYKQQANGFPEYILITTTYTEGKGEGQFKDRFHSKADSASKTAPLIIQDLQVSDAAVYYCALRPTVTAALTTLIQKPVYSVHIALFCFFELLDMFHKGAV